MQDHPTTLRTAYCCLDCKVVFRGRPDRSYVLGLSSRVNKIGIRAIFPRQGWAHHTIFKRLISEDLPSTMTSVLQENRSENLPGPIDKKQKKDDPVITTLRVKKLSADATLPKRGSAKAAGYDLSSAKDLVVPAHGKALVPTDISIAIPPGTYARVAPRSGLAHKHFIDTGAGVVDEDYRGPVGVILFNHSSEDFNVRKGDRIAQLILERILTPEVEEVDDLSETVRGAGGYGSTGVSV